MKKNSIFEEPTPSKPLPFTAEIDINEKISYADPQGFLWYIRCFIQERMVQDEIKKIRKKIRNS